MRELILERIEQLRIANKGFSETQMRWGWYKINDIHVSKVSFEGLSDAELLKAFESILNRASKQM